MTVGERGQTGERAQGGGLSGTVRTEEGDHFAGGDGERDVQAEGTAVHDETGVETVGGGAGADAGGGGSRLLAHRARSAPRRPGSPAPAGRLSLVPVVTGLGRRTAPPQALPSPASAVRLSSALAGPPPPASAVRLSSALAGPPPPASAVRLSSALAGPPPPIPAVPPSLTLAVQPPPAPAAQPPPTGQA